VPIILGAGHAARSCMSAGFRSALSGNTTVDASFQKALYYGHFWNPCAGIVFALRVLGFLGPILLRLCLVKSNRTLDSYL
jgi:hypothetical protein